MTAAEIKSFNSLFKTIVAIGLSLLKIVGTATINDLLYVTDVKPGSPFIQLTATDVDLDTLLTYSIVGGNDNNAFSVDRRNGEIYVNRRMDAGTVSSYQLCVQVTYSTI